MLTDGEDPTPKLAMVERKPFAVTNPGEYGRALALSLKPGAPPATTEPRYHATAVAVMLTEKIRSHLEHCLRTIRGVDCPDLLNIVHEWAQKIARVTPEPPATTDEGAALIERIEAAQRRVQQGLAPMRIPAEHTDVDIVLEDCRTEIIRLRDRESRAREEGRKEGLEQAAEVGSQEAWDTAYAEEKAVSKGGAPYTTAFRAANAASRVGTAIRALSGVPQEDKGE